MGFWKRLWNMVTAPGGSGRDTAGLNEDKLLEWLGIDKEKPKALQETTYFTCLKVLSEAMGKMPLKLYKEDSGGGRERAELDESTDVVLNRPNPYMSPSTFWTAMEFNCQHHGNAYAWVQWRTKRSGRYGGSRQIAGLWPMRSDCVTVYMDNAGIFGKTAGGLYYEYTNPDSGQTYVFDQDSVLHVKTWMTWEGVMGKSVQDILRTTLAGAGYSQKYLEELYRSGLTASSVLQYTGDLESAKVKLLQKKYSDILTGAKNAGKVVPIPIGMELKPLSYKLADAQFLELRKYTALQIAAAFGVKPDQINDYTKSSYSSSESQQLDFLVNTMLYRLSIYEQEINYKLLTQEERKNGYIYKFNEKVLLRANTETQMQSLTSAVKNGIYTPNEARHQLDLPSKDGGDVLIVNGNYVPLDNVGAAYRNA